MHCIILAYLWDWRGGDAFLNFAVKMYNVQIEIEIELKFENSGSQKIVVFYMRNVHVILRTQCYFHSN